MPTPKQLIVAGLAAAIVVAGLAYFAVTKGGAFVIALQMTAMLTAALGPVAIYTYVQRRRDAEDGDRGAEDR